MRRIILSFVTLCTLFLAGCLETTQEITLNENGSGTISNANDMSAILGLLKQMGGGAEMEKMGIENVDSSVSMKEVVDSIPNLSPEEKEMVRKGTLKIKINFKEDKFSTTIGFPFSSISQIDDFNKLSGKIMSEGLKDMMNKRMPGMPMGSDEMKESSSFDDYYNLEFSNGELTKKVNKTKYAEVSGDEYLKSMKEASSTGLVMKANYIIHLPRPATKAEGKNVKLSTDKKKVTISADIEDFFDDPASLEFKIKY